MVPLRCLNYLSILLCCTFASAKLDKRSEIKANTDSIITQADLGNGLIPGRIKIFLDEPFLEPCNSWCRWRKYLSDVNYIRNEYLNRKEQIKDVYRSNKIPGLFLYNSLLRREKDIATRTNRLQQAAELLAHRFSPLYQMLAMLLPTFNLDITPETARLPGGTPSPPQLSQIPPHLLQRIPPRFAPILRRPIAPFETSTFTKVETQVTPLSSNNPLASFQELRAQPTGTSAPVPTPIPAPPLPSPLFLTSSQIPVPPKLVLSVVPPPPELRELSVASPVQSIFGILPTPVPSQNSSTTVSSSNPSISTTLINPSTPISPTPSPSPVFRGETGIVIASTTSTSETVATPATTN